MHGCEKHSRTEKRHGCGQEFRMSVMAFRNEVARAYIQEESGENSQDYAQRLFWQRKEERRSRAEDRGQSIDDQPFESRFPYLTGRQTFSLVLQDHIDGIYAVGEIVDQDGDGNDSTDDRRYLES